MGTKLYVFWSKEGDLNYSQPKVNQQVLFSVIV